MATSQGVLDGDLDTFVHAYLLQRATGNGHPAEATSERVRVGRFASLRSQDLEGQEQRC